MKNFVKLKEKYIKFQDCSNCDARCCKGSYGTIYSQILKEEFKTLYKQFPILFIFGTLDFVKPVVLLSNGTGNCPYLNNKQCTIYENRPNVCKNYPLSPNIDNLIYFDSSCPEINRGENYLDLENEIFKNYQEQYIQTHFEFKNLQKKDFKTLFTIKGVKFYSYIGQNRSNFLNYHILSLENLNRLRTY